MRSRFFSWKAFAIVWSSLITILFFLPGSALPKENWLGDIYFDKWVHFGFFAVLLFSWAAAFEVRSKWMWLLLAAIVYGAAVEFIQRDWVPNRDFDLYDLLADTLGAIAGLVVWLRVYKKNKPL